MTGAQGISYNISYQLNGTGLGERNQSSSTAGLSSNLTSLSSGTCYTITVKTMGPQNLESTSVYTSECTCEYTCDNRTVDCALGDVLTVKMFQKYSETFLIILHALTHFIS